MAAPRKVRRLNAEGFDVVCTIGRVEFADTGMHTPYEAAFLLIAQHGANGTFSFPAEAGGLMHVTVEHDDDSLPEMR